MRSLTDQSIKIGVRAQGPLGDQLLTAGGTLFIAGETTRKHVDLLPPENSPDLLLINVQFGPRYRFPS